jgi:hypothetical protein
MIIFKKRYIQRIWDELALHVPEMKDLPLVFDNEYVYYEEQICDAVHMIVNSDMCICYPLKWEYNNVQFVTKPWIRIAASSIKRVAKNINTIPREAWLSIIELYLKEYNIPVTLENILKFIVLHEVGHYQQILKGHTGQELTAEYDEAKKIKGLEGVIHYRTLPFEADADLYALTTLSRILGGDSSAMVSNM